jgi:imidazolonepropionase-like amidohydrolase
MLIKAGQLIDGTGSAPRQNWFVLVEAGIISALGPEQDFAAEDIDRAVDLSHLTILPGLIDAHAHVFLEGICDLKERKKRWRESEDITFIRAYRNLEAGLRKGVTTVRDLGGPYAINTRLKRAVEQKVFRGSRVLTCNRAISVTGGHFHYAGGCEADGALAMVQAVQEQVAAGADWVKVMMTGYVDFRTGDAGRVEPSMQETKALVQEACRLEKPVAAHANGVAGVRQAITAGVATIEHGALLDEATVGFLISKSTYWVPTLLPFQRMLEYSREYQCTSLPQHGIESVYAAHRNMVQKAILVDAPILAGTDAGALGVNHGDIWRELSLFVELGMPPLRAIRSATGLAAKALGISREIGTLTVGKRADMVTVQGDPLLNMSCLQKVRHVFLDGVQVV